jgi:hypothetical protein
MNYVRFLKKGVIVVIVCSLFFAACKETIPEVYVINEIPGDESSGDKSTDKVNDKPIAGDKTSNGDNKTETPDPVEGEDLSFPELGPYEPSSYYPFIYMTVNDKYYLHFNAFGRGRDSKQIPDTFILQKDGSEGEFPVGKWINVSNNGEYVEFTSTHWTRYSPYTFLGTLISTYTISDGVFYIKVVSHTYGQ